MEEIEPRFKIGDKVRSKTRPNLQAKIDYVQHGRYGITYTKVDGKGNINKNDTRTIGVEIMDTQCDPCRIRNTKIARKMHPEYKVIDENWLEVR